MPKNHFKHNFKLRKHSFPSPVKPGGRCSERLGWENYAFFI